MNKIYKVIWSKAKNCYVVASELAKRSGKSAQKAIVGAIITGILSVGMAGDVLAAEFGYSYDAAALLTAVANDENTGLGFSLIRGDRRANVLNYHLGINYVRRYDAATGTSWYEYQAGFYDASGNFTQLRDAQSNPLGDGTLETAYEIIKNRPGTTYTYRTGSGRQVTVTFVSGFYFDNTSMYSYLKDVRGYSDETVGKLMLTDD